MFRNIISATALAFIASSALAQATPPAKKEAFSEKVFSVEIDDAYRWMEDPKRAEELRAWVTASGRVTAERMKAVPERERFAALTNEAAQGGVAVSQVMAVGNRLFYLRRDVGAQVEKLVVRAGETEEVVLDPALDRENKVSINNYSVSPDAKTVAIHTAKGGGEVGEIRFLDLATKRWKETVLAPVWGEFEVRWFDNTTIAYTQMQAGTKDPLQGMRAKIAKLERTSAHVSVLGHGVDAKIASGAAAFAAETFPRIVSSPISRWSIGIASGARADFLFFAALGADVVAGKPDWREVISLEDRVRAATVRGDRLYMVSRKTQSNGELLVQTLDKDASKESKRDALSLPANLILNDIQATRDGVYATGETDGASRLFYFADGKGGAREVRLPFEARLAGATASVDAKSLTFALIGWTRAAEYFSATADVVKPLGLATYTWPKAQRVQVIREEAVCVDGTRVPLTILAPTGGQPRNLPTILSGYGSYGVNSTSPGYSPQTLSWIVAGNARAFCGTRGGGEKGRAWHDGGRGANKPNAHGDFIACAERLIALGIATPKGIAAIGTSMGGLLTPIAVAKRPDLFGASIARVAVLNPTRLAVANNGANQFAEAGNPNTEEGFRALLVQDAYHALSSAKDLPDTMVTIGLNDRRVEPWMSAKFAARAIERFGDKRHIMIRTDPDAGHGIGSTVNQVVEEWADIYAFVWERLGRKGDR